MSSNSQNDNDTRAQKRAQFNEPTTPRHRSRQIAVVVIIVFVALGAVLMFGSKNGSETVTSSAPAAGSTGAVAASEVRIPLAKIEGNKAQFFEYPTANKKVSFFVVRSTDGQYRAALNACDVCFHAKKGYSQLGEHMVCNNCGMRFDTNKINEVSGGCNPVGLSRTVKDGHLVLSASDLEKGSSYF